MEFKVLSKAEVESKEVQEKLNKKHILLSITDTHASLPSIPINKNRLGIFYMLFDDVDTNTEGIKPYQVFNKLQAESLLTYIDGMLEKFKDIEQIIVHCFAGVSRSVGMASALCKIINGDDTKIFKSGVPNMTVYRTILEQYYGHNEPYREWPEIYKRTEKNV